MKKTEIFLVLVFEALVYFLFIYYCLFLARRCLGTRFEKTAFQTVAAAK